MDGAPGFGDALGVHRTRAGRGVHPFCEIAWQRAPGSCGSCPPTASERKFTTEVPCCGRRITIPAPGNGETSPAACCRCRVLYTAAVAEEERDGYSDEPPKVAVFVVEHVNVAVAQHRAGKWERSSGGAT
jgi:hypothetical protein